MKYIKFAVMLFLIVVAYSCSSGKKIANVTTGNESYVEYLSSVINDTAYFEFPELTIVDSNVYPILDSLISWSERCRYFDTRVRYLHCFRFGFRFTPENKNLLYSIDAHLSPAQAIGLFLLQKKIIDKINNIGIFYYRHFLFVVPTGKFRNRDGLEYFPFLNSSRNVLKIRAPEFVDERDHSSYVIYSIENSEYKIETNNLCGKQILIQ